MDKSLFEIIQMDCAAEENLVRMKLDNVKAIRRLDFDLSARRLTIYHEGKLDTIEKAIGELNLNSRLLKTEPTSEIVDDSSMQKSLLWTVLRINFSFFVLEVLFGFISGSMGLVADSLDMLADAIVYGLSLRECFKSGRVRLENDQIQPNLPDRPEVYRMATDCGVFSKFPNG
ncbi:MAG: hypothetical protein AB1607_15545, partial [Chloroflexota bacterium]